VITDPEEGKPILEYAGRYGVTPFMAIKSLVRFGAEHWHQLDRIPWEQLRDANRVCEEQDPLRAIGLLDLYVRTYVRTEKREREAVEAKQ